MVHGGPTSGDASAFSVDAARCLPSPGRRRLPVQRTRTKENKAVDGEANDKTSPAGLTRTAARQLYVVFPACSTDGARRYGARERDEHGALPIRLASWSPAPVSYSDSASEAQHSTSTSCHIPMAATSKKKHLGSGIWRLE
jgi:hypothetical protein